MKMKSQRKVERDRAKREASRTRPRTTTESEPTDETLDEADLQVSRSVLGYDE